MNRYGYSTLRPSQIKEGKANAWALNVPRVIVAALAEANPAERLVFKPELTEEGILFRWVGSEPEQTIDLPAWAKNGAKP